MPWIYVINYCNEKEIVERFLTKKCKKTNQNKFELKKVMKRKGDKWINGMAMIIILATGLIKKTQYKWMNIFLNQNLCGEE